LPGEKQRNPNGIITRALLNNKVAVQIKMTPDFIFCGSHKLGNVYQAIEFDLFDNNF
jgi:hypothetical protein